MSFLLTLSIASSIASLISVALIQKYFSPQLLDISNQHSSHTLPTSGGGGLGSIVASTIISALAAIVLRLLFPFLPLWLALIPSIVVSIIQDRQEVPAAIRNLVPLSSASIAIACFVCFPQPWSNSFGLNLLVAGRISIFKEIGPWGSLVGILLAIILAEIYRQSFSKKYLKIYNINYTTSPKSINICKYIFAPSIGTNTCLK